MASVPGSAQWDSLQGPQELGGLIKHWGGRGNVNPVKVADSRGRVKPKLGSLQRRPGHPSQPTLASACCMPAKVCSGCCGVVRMGNWATVLLELKSWWGREASPRDAATQKVTGAVRWDDDPTPSGPGPAPWGVGLGPFAWSFMDVC